MLRSGCRASIDKGYRLCLREGEGAVQIIGESINSTIHEVGKAISNRDGAFIAKLARKQVTAGADMLDINVAVAEGNETDNLVWAVSVVQEAVDVPLVLDSGNPDALKAALKVHRGRSIISSISGEERKLTALLPLAATHDCDVVLLCLSDKGIPKTADGRYAVARFLVEQAIQKGIEPESLYIDPLVMAVGSDWQAARVALETLHLIRQELPRVHTVAGISNVSFGMPHRSLLNRTLLAMAMAQGLSACMVHVADKALMGTLQTADTLMGNDTYCSDYLEAYHAGKLST
jgi:5-methyltetrahydrofolate--homocysteine methyltransferase